MQKNMLDTMHRGYYAYLENTENDPECEKFRQSVLRTDKKGELCDTALCTCEVSHDWIEQIEQALPYLDRAVRENRQFILRQGETVPIEKVRRVSKTSVEHLARHSELITREPDPGEELIPEKMFMTENVGTYAVYENRFLYMLLCYIRDFCNIKFTRITELSSFFSSEIEFEKTISSKKKKIDFSLKFKEVSTENTPSELDTDTSESLVRIKNIISSVDTLLKTGLMVEVSSAPLLKPPISRTNVLLQNPCFVKAVELYDYLVAYSGDGYTQKDIYRNKGAFSDEVREDYAELLAITSYLSYRHGGLSEELDLNYQKAKEEKAEKERLMREERMLRLKERLGDISDEAFEYIGMLEEKCADQDKRISELSSGDDKLLLAQEQIRDLEEEHEKLQKSLEETKKELLRVGEIARLDLDKHRHELDSASLLVRQKDDEVKKAIANCQATLERQRAKFEAEYSALAEKYHLLSARSHAKQAKDGVSDMEDMFSKESFSELEAEYKAFKRYFDAQWKKAKKDIRKKELWQKPKQNGKQ